MTANKAAAEIRHKIIRKMEELESVKHVYSFTDRWRLLREYIEGMAKRASAKPGGLGRRVRLSTDKGHVT